MTEAVQQPKNDILKNALILFIITAMAGLLLSLTYNATKEAIEEQQLLKLERALDEVIADAKFEEIVPDNAFSKEGKVTIQGLFKAKDSQGQLMGYAFKVATKEGYGGLLEMMVGISADGQLTGIDIITHAETPGLGARADLPEFKDQFIGKKASSLTVVKGDAGADQIDAIGGATITSSAVTEAVNQVIDYYQTTLGGGGHDE